MDSELLRLKLDKGLINSRLLLSRHKVVDLMSRDSPSFNDTRYLPFYYHLGSQVSPETVVQVGSVLGLVGACFMQSCKTVKRWNAIDQTEPETGYWPMSIIQANLSACSSVWCTMTTDSAIGNVIKPQSVDLCFVTDKTNWDLTTGMEWLWDRLKYEGLLVVDYIQDDVIGRSFHDFCRVKNREPLVFETRYGVGIITR